MGDLDAAENECASWKRGNCYLVLVVCVLLHSCLQARVIAFLIIYGDTNVKRPRFVLAYLHYSVMTAISRGWERRSMNTMRFLRTETRASFSDLTSRSYIYSQTLPYI